ncbi:MAG: ATP-binding protein [Oscillatoria sp. SIO1A7]|nr:ATP-binding protein [Oscillatoria sp. SIO1A7]
MLTIDRIIKREPNPFDAETFWSGNFWQEEQDPELTVESIHREAIEELHHSIACVAQDHRTRTLLLEGETGSGKTYLLGRLKRILNRNVFFAYIEPFTDSDYIWRHILRYTVDSLLEIPAGHKESQLLLWLKGLWAYKHRGLLDWLRGERQMFVRNIRAIYPAGIYNATEFFGALYDLTNPKLSRLACEWLRGDDLDEEQLKALRVQHSIDTEDAAQKILANIGRISAETQPIILCFDQLDNIARLSDGSIDLQSLFSVNSVIHNQKLKNFVIILSIITDTWRRNAHRIQPTDKDRIDSSIMLGQINLDEAENLWESRLSGLHEKADTSLYGPSYPLSREMLEEKFPGGKTRPRNTLILGRQLYQEYKLRLLEDGEGNNNGSNNIEPAVLEAELITDDRLSELGRAEQLAEQNGKSSGDSIAAFKLVWLRKFQQTAAKISRIRQYSSPEMASMLAEVLAAMQAREIQQRFLPSRIYSSYSVSYEPPGDSNRVGVVWTEDVNLVKFCNLVKACSEAVEQELCQTLVLIRSVGTGKSNNQGYKLYSQLFAGNPHYHIVPDLTSIHYLATYHSLVNDTYSGDLVVGEQVPNLQELETWSREAGVFQHCSLLEDLGLIQPPPPLEENEALMREVEDFLVSRAINQQCIARQRLVSEAIAQFSEASNVQVDSLLSQLCEQNGNIKIIDPNAKLEEQLVYAVANE